MLLQWLFTFDLERVPYRAFKNNSDQIPSANRCYIPALNSPRHMNSNVQLHVAVLGS